MLPARVAGWAAVIALSAVLASCGGDTSGKSVENAPSLSAATPSATTPSVASQPAEAPIASDYRRTLARLEALVRSGKREMNSMVEISREAAVNPGQFSTQIQLWEDLDSEWSDDLNTIEGMLPEKALSEGVPKLRTVHENLESAIAELRRVPLVVSQRKAPSKAEREARLARAEELLRSARLSLYDSN